MKRILLAALLLAFLSSLPCSVAQRPKAESSAEGTALTKVDEVRLLKAKVALLEAQMKQLKKQLTETKQALDELKLAVAKNTTYLSHRKKKEILAPIKAKAEAKARTSGPLKYSIVRTAKLGGTHLDVHVKVTNIGSRTIQNAEVTCIVYNASGQEIGFDTEWVILQNSTTTLQSHASIYHAFLVPVDLASAKGVGFRTGKIEY